MAETLTPIAALEGATSAARALEGCIADIHRLQRSSHGTEKDDAAELSRLQAREVPDDPQAAARLAERIEAQRTKVCAWPEEHERMARLLGEQRLTAPGIIAEVQLTSAPVRQAVIDGVRRYAARAIGPLLEGATIEALQRNAAAIPGLASCTLDTIVGNIIHGSDFAARVRQLEQEASHLASTEDGALCYAVKWGERHLELFRDMEAFLARHDRAEAAQ